MGLGGESERVVTRFRRRLTDDRGSSVIEIAVALAVSMIVLVIGGNVLVAAQRQERAVNGTSGTVDAARIALDDLANELREAHSLQVQDGDARAWFDHDRDGSADLGEVALFAFEPDGDLQQLVRVVDDVTSPIARTITGGSFATAVLTNGTRLTITITVPGVDGRAGTELTSEVTTRANL